MVIEMRLFGKQLFSLLQNKVVCKFVSGSMHMRRGQISFINFVLLIEVVFKFRILGRNLKDVFRKIHKNPKG